MYTHTYIRTELGRITGRVDVEELLDIIFRDFCSETRTCTQAYMYASTSSSATSAVSGRHYLYMNTHPSEGVALDSLQLANEHSCGHMHIHIHHPREWRSIPCSWQMSTRVGTMVWAQWHRAAGWAWSVIRSLPCSIQHRIKQRLLVPCVGNWSVCLPVCMYVCMYVPCVGNWPVCRIDLAGSRRHIITCVYIYIYVQTEKKTDRAMQR